MSSRPRHTTSKNECHSLIPFQVYDQLLALQLYSKSQHFGVILQDKQEESVENHSALTCQYWNLLPRQMQRRGRQTRLF